MKRILTVVVIVLVASLMAAPVALACGFLVSANGAVRLGTTTTFVVWEDGIEHYITNFTFEGPAESFGSLIPLPAEPTDVTRAGTGRCSDCSGRCRLSGWLASPRQPKGPPTAWRCCCGRGSIPST